MTAASSRPSWSAEVALPAESASIFHRRLLWCEAQFPAERSPDVAQSFRAIADLSATPARDLRRRGTGGGHQRRVGGVRAAHRDGGRVAGTGRQGRRPLLFL